MDVIDQSLDDRLSPLQAAFPRTDGVAKLAFDHRVHYAGLPTLSIQATQAYRRNQIGTRLALRVEQAAAPPNGRN